MFTILGGDGKEYGPVSAARIAEWIAGGRANFQTKARRAGDADWKTLGDFVEFNPAAAAAAAVPLEATPPPVALTPAAAPSPSIPTVPAEVELPSRWLRLGAAILDSILGCIVMGPGIVLLVMAGAFGAEHQTPNAAFSVAGMIACLLGFVALLAVQIYLLVTRGQTVGKKLVGIRIVTYPEGENPGFVKAVLLRLVVNGVIGSVPFLGAVYTLVDICFIFRADKRCIHDLIAGTHVVKA